MIILAVVSWENWQTSDALESIIIQFQMHLRGHSLSTLRRFCLILTTYPPLVDIWEEIPFVKSLKICIPLTFSVLPTYLVLSTQFVNAPLPMAMQFQAWRNLWGQLFQSKVWSFYQYLFCKIIVPRCELHSFPLF